VRIGVPYLPAASRASRSKLVCICFLLGSDFRTYSDVRRRSRPVMISMCAGSLGRGMGLGVCLGPPRCARCPVENGGRPTRRGSERCTQLLRPGWLAKAPAFRGSPLAAARRVQRDVSGQDARVKCQFRSAQPSNIAQCYSPLPALVREVDAWAWSPHPPVKRSNAPESRLLVGTCISKAKDCGSRSARIRGEGHSMSLIRWALEPVGSHTGL
jgi:hypothetical protein